MATRRPLSSLLGISMAAVLLLTSCSEGGSDEEAGQPTQEAPSNPADEGSSAPEPTGDQLSHDDMRSAVEAHLSGATLTDTDDYWGDLRSIETELQKLDVEPVDCKQYVVESATPVPDGALLVHADTSGEDDVGESPAPEGLEGEASPSPADDSDADDSDTNESEENESEENESDEGSSDGGASDEEAQVDDVPGLQTERQVTVYSYADWRAAQSHFAGEEDGVDTCGSYTATRDSSEESGDVEVTTTIEAVDVEVNDGSDDSDSDDGDSDDGDSEDGDSEDGDSDGSSDEGGVTADEAMAMTQDVELDGEADRALGVMVRHGSLLVSIVAPMEQQAGDGQAEDAAEALAAEAESLLDDLEG